MKRSIELIIFSFLMFNLTGCASFDETYENKYESGEYDIEVSPTTIYSVYSNNVLDGNKKYAGKRLKITSTFKDVSSGTFSGLMLTLDKAYCGSFNSEKDASKLSELDKGQSVTVIGTAGEWIESFTDGNLQLEDCEIVSY